MFLPTIVLRASAVAAAEVAARPGDASLVVGRVAESSPPSSASCTSVGRSGCLNREKESERCQVVQGAE